jgi:hypothetical protein
MYDFQTVRRFTHIEKFKDDVDHIEYYEDGYVTFILKDGDKVLGNKADINGFEKMVNEKKWKELKSYKIWSSSESHLFKDLYGT